MKAYLFIPLIYFILGCLWILTSDWVVQLLSSGDIAYLTDLQTAKGWFFVLLSTILILFLTRTAWVKQEHSIGERKRLFRKTIEGSCHILLNYLNQMQLVTLEAERSLDFDKKLVAAARQISREASDELVTLQQLEFEGPSDLEDFIHGKIRSSSKNSPAKSS